MSPPVLTRTVRLVVVQFSFSNLDEVPRIIRRREPETPDQSREWKSHATGRLVVKPTENCSAASLLQDLEGAGYRMVDAFSEERIHPANSFGKRAYQMVRFIFARREKAVIAEEFLRVRDATRIEFARMCERALWRVRAFENPLYVEGAEVPDEASWSVNLEARKPLFQGNGKPVVVWQKGESGRRVGDAPLPLAASRHLRLVRGALCLVEV